MPENEALCFGVCGNRNVEAHLQEMNADFPETNVQVFGSLT